MKRIFLLLAIGIITVGALFACAPKVVPVEEPKSPEPLTQEARAVGKEPWQIEWDKTVAMAKKEGRVIFYTSAGPETREALKKATMRFEIEIDFVSGRGADIAQKIIINDPTVSGPGVSPVVNAAYEYC